MLTCKLPKMWWRFFVCIRDSFYANIAIHVFLYLIDFSLHRHLPSHVGQMNKIEKYPRALLGGRNFMLKNGSIAPRSVISEKKEIVYSERGQKLVFCGEQYVHQRINLCHDHLTEPRN